MGIGMIILLLASGSFPFEHLFVRAEAIVAVTTLLIN